MRGTAMSLSPLRKMIPNGAIQFPGELDPALGGGHDSVDDAQEQSPGGSASGACGTSASREGTARGPTGNNGSAVSECAVLL